MTTFIFANLTPAELRRLKRADVWHTTWSEPLPRGPFDPWASTVDSLFLPALVALGWEQVALIRRSPSTWIVRHLGPIVAKATRRTNPEKTRKR